MYIVVGTSSVVFDSCCCSFQMKGIDDHSRGIIETFNIVHTEVVDRLSDLMLIPKSFNPLIDEKRKQRRRQSQEMLSPTAVSSRHQRNTSNAKPHWHGLGLTQSISLGLQVFFLSS